MCSKRKEIKSTAEFIIKNIPSLYPPDSQTYLVDATFLNLFKSFSSGVTREEKFSSILLGSLNGSEN